MKNILVIFGSTTGNSQSVVDFFSESLKLEANFSLVNCAYIKNRYSFDNGFDLVILCTSTWGIEPPELQEDFEIFWLKLDKNSIANKSFFIIGLGDDYYPHFAAAADILQKEIIDNKGVIVETPLKIQDHWEDSKNFILSTIKKIVAKS